MHVFFWLIKHIAELYFDTSSDAVNFTSFRTISTKKQGMIFLPVLQIFDYDS